jgi:hypothetical protein
MIPRNLIGKTDSNMIKAGISREPLSIPVSNLVASNSNLQSVIGYKRAAEVHIAHSSGDQNVISATNLLDYIKHSIERKAESKKLLRLLNPWLKA